MSCIYYKFKASTEFDTIRFDGLHITLTDVKNAITAQKKLGRGAPNTVLQIINAQTGEEYTNEDQNIPKNTSVIVSRVPILSATGNLSPLTDQASQSPQSMDGVQKTASVQQLMDAPDMSRMDASEEDKIRAMMHLSVKEYDPANFVRKSYFNGPPFRPQGKPHPNYICHRCRQPGHFIYDCPLKGTEIDRLYYEAKLKRSTGIPNSFLRPVNDPTGKPGVMRNDQGGYVINAMDAAAFSEGKIEKPPFVPDDSQNAPPEEKNIPVELMCDLCKDILTDAVVVPCCGHSFCDECIRSALLQAEDHQCPHCHEIDVSPDKLISNAFLRKAVISFQNDTGYAKTSKPAEVPKTEPVLQPEAVHLSSTGVQIAPGAVPAGAHTYIIQPGQTLPAGMVLVSKPGMVVTAPAQVVMASGALNVTASNTQPAVLVAPHASVVPAPGLPAGAGSPHMVAPPVTGAHVAVSHSSEVLGAPVVLPRPAAPIIHPGAPMPPHGAPGPFIGHPGVRMPHPAPGYPPGAPHPPMVPGLHAPAPAPYAMIPGPNGETVAVATRKIVVVNTTSSCRRPDCARHRLEPAADLADEADEPAHTGSSESDTAVGPESEAASAAGEDGLRGPTPYGAPVVGPAPGERPLTEAEFYRTKMMMRDKRSHTDQMMDEFAKQLADIDRKTADTKPRSQTPARSRSRSRSPYRPAGRSRSPYSPRRRSYSRSPYRSRRSLSPARRRSYSRSPVRRSPPRYRYGSRSPGPYRARSRSPRYRSRSPNYRSYRSRGRRYGGPYTSYPYQAPQRYAFDPRYDRRDLGPQQYHDYMAYSAAPEYPLPPPVPGTEPPLSSPKKTRKEKRERNDDKSPRKRRKLEMTVEEEADEIIRRAEAEDLGLLPPEEEPSPPGVDPPEKPVCDGKSPHVIVSETTVNTDANKHKKAKKSSSKTDVDKDGKKRRRKRTKADKGGDAKINEVKSNEAKISEVRNSEAKEDNAPDSTVEVSSSTDKPGERITTPPADETKPDKVLVDETKPDVQTPSQKSKSPQKPLTPRKSSTKPTRAKSGAVTKAKTGDASKTSADDSIKLKLVKRTKIRRVVKTETAEAQETMTHEEEHPQPEQKPQPEIADVEEKSVKAKDEKTKSKGKKSSPIKVRKPKVMPGLKESVKPAASETAVVASITKEPVEKKKSNSVEITSTGDREKPAKKPKKVEKRKESVGGEVLDLLADDHDMDDLLGGTDDKLLAEVPTLSKWEREDSASEEERKRPEPPRKSGKSQVNRHVRETATDKHVREKPRAVLHSKVVATHKSQTGSPASSLSSSPDRKSRKYKTSHKDDGHYKRSDYTSRRHQDKYRYRDLDYDDVAEYRSSSRRSYDDASYDRHSSRRQPDSSRRKDREQDDGNRYVESSAHDLKVTVQEPQSQDDLRHKIRRAREEKQREEGQRVIVMKPNDRRPVKTDTALENSTASSSESDSDSDSSTSDSETERRRHKKSSKHKKHKHHKKHRKHKHRKHKQHKERKEHRRDRE